MLLLSSLFRRAGHDNLLLAGYFIPYFDMLLGWWCVGNLRKRPDLARRALNLQLLITVKLVRQEPGSLFRLIDLVLYF